MYFPIGFAVGWLAGDFVFGLKPETPYIVGGLLVIQLIIIYFKEIRNIK